MRLILYSLMILVPSILLNIFYVRSGAGMFAILMRYMLVIMADINEFLDTLSNQENRMISFERCNYFVNIDPEKGYKNLPAIQDQMSKGYTPSIETHGWPKTGSVEFKGLKVRYR